MKRSKTAKYKIDPFTKENLKILNSEFTKLSNNLRQFNIRISIGTVTFQPEIFACKIIGIRPIPNEPVKETNARKNFFLLLKWHKIRRKYLGNTFVVNGKKAVLIGIEVSNPIEFAIKENSVLLKYIQTGEYFNSTVRFMRSIIRQIEILE